MSHGCELRLILSTELDAAPKQHLRGMKSHTRQLGHSTYVSNKDMSTDLKDIVKYIHRKSLQRFPNERTGYSSLLSC